VKHKLIINSEGVRNRAIEIIKTIPYSTSVVHEVVIQEHKKNRSLEMNALYWQWLTIIGNELGESKEECHERYKSDFLVHIYERDDPEYSATIEAIREVWRHGLKAEAAGLRKKIVSLTSTTGATVKQMSEYLHCIEMSAAKMAIRLPFPEDEL
jgi:hypothetical protein